MAVRGKITIDQITKKEFANSKVFQNLAYGAAKRKAEAVKKRAIDEFNQHEVTKELERGTSGRNSLLLGGRGNFFGFLGFNQGERPLEIIRDIIERKISLKSKKGKLKKVTKTTFQWDFDMNIPSKSDIYAVTPMAWSSKSWVKGVEGGITNYSKTIFKDTSRSRSGIALQTQRNVGFITFSPTPYITELLDKLRRELK
tara:strand:- start:2467 stop:3063 length:597 start_codon:yes stop_codon:yes gene_type:complete